MKAFERVRWFGNTAAVLLVGLLTFSSQLEQLIALSWFRLIVTTMDQLKYELICLLLIVVLWPQIRRVSHKILAQILEHFRAGRYIRLTVWLGVLATGLAIGTYQLAWYYVGKSELYLALYENKILMRANTAFENGNVEEARRILEGCDYVLLPADCETALRRLEERLAEADAFLEKHEDKPLWSTAWLQLPEQVYEIDHRVSRRTDLKDQVRQFYLKTKDAYADAVASVERQEWPKAKDQFYKISREFPWFGDAERIVAEINRRMVSSGNPRTPLLGALERLGAEEFVRVMTAPWMQDVRSP